MAGQPKKRSAVFILGLLVLLFLFALYFLFFIYGVSRELPLRARHLLKFLFIVLAWGTGAWALRRSAAAGLLPVWQVVYGLGLLLLVLLGAYDWAISRAPFELRSMADTVQEFLVSPVLYVVLGLVAKNFPSGKQG